MLKREWGAECNWKLPHLSIPSKTAAWVPQFEVKDLPLGRTAALVPEFAVKDLPLGRILMIIVMRYIYHYYFAGFHSFFMLKGFRGIEKFEEGWPRGLSFKLVRIFQTDDRKENAKILNWTAEGLENELRRR